jgi:glycosyltransferase involved in cell wall biosynthesis
MAQSLKILYLIGGRRIGGMETHVVRLVEKLRHSFSCLVCCLDPSAEYVEQLESWGIEYRNLQCPTLMTPSALLRCATLKTLVDEFRPDIVHAYGFAADVLATIIKVSRRDVRLITSRRSEDGNRRHQRVRRIANRWSEKVVCVSSEVAHFVRATEKTRSGLLEVIPNGVPIQFPQRRRSGSQGLVRFGTLGTVKPVKGTDLLVDAFMKFDTRADVELVIAGLIDRPWAEALRARASVDNRITFLGRSSDSPAFLSGIDVFVLPSRSEGMSNALLEAMALGIPCIATNVGSNRTLVTPPDLAPGGVVCEPTSDALLQAMKDLACDPEAHPRYGGAALRIVRERYSVDTMVRQYENLYQTIGRPGSVGVICTSQPSSDCTIDHAV